MAIWVGFSSPISKEFEAESASVGAGSRPIAGGAFRKAQIDDFVLNKRNDILSPQLMLHCAKGTPFALVTIEFYTRTNILYMTYKLTNVIITSFQSNRSNGDRAPTESVSLISETMSSEYFKTSPAP